MLELTADWSAWLRRCGQPALFALGGNWQEPNASALASIRSELRGLGAVLVVGAKNAQFCLGPDDAPRRVPALDGRGLKTLRHALGTEMGDPSGPALTLTLVDEDGTARMRTEWSSLDDPAAFITDMLGWAGRSLIDSATHWAPGDRSWLRFSRRELVVLSLIGAMALPFAVGCEPHTSKVPRPEKPRPATSSRGNRWRAGALSVVDLDRFELVHADTRKA